MSTAKKRYVKLGEKAAEGSFFDPTLNLKVLPGKMIELPSKFRTSKKTVSALAGGHLEYVDSEEVDKFLAETDDVEDEDDDTVTEAQLKKYNMAELIEFIVENDEDVDPEDLENYKKAELFEAAVVLLN